MPQKFRGMRQILRTLRVFLDNSRLWPLECRQSLRVQVPFHGRHEDELTALLKESSVAVGNVGLAARIGKQASTTTPFRTFLSRYFYLCMSLVLAALVVLGFRRTVNINLLHANPPRPLLLWVHGVAFSTWIVFFIAQSALVRARKVSVH